MAAALALIREVAALDRSMSAGSLPDLRHALREFTPAHAPMLHFGEWPTALRLAAAHHSAAVHSLAVYSAVLRNVDQAGVRLLATSENYRQAERNMEDAFAGRRGLAGAARLRPAHAPPPPESVGALTVSRMLPYPEVTEEYDPDLIMQWLRPLLSNRVCAAHYGITGKWHTAAEAVHSLCGALFRQAEKIDDSWQSDTSATAQEKLRRIEGTAQSLAGFMWALMPMARCSAEALEVVSTELQSGGAITWNRVGRRSRIRRVFGELNNQYREIINAYPRSLPYDLPFGGTPPDEPSLAGPSSSPDPDPDPPMAPTGHYVPPIIGAELPSAMTFNIDRDPWLNDIDPHGPGTIGGEN